MCNDNMCDDDDNDDDDDYDMNDCDVMLLVIIVGSDVYHWALNISDV